MKTAPQAQMVHLTRSCKPNPCTCRIAHIAALFLLIFHQSTFAQSASDDAWWDDAIGNPGLNGPAYAVTTSSNRVYVVGKFTMAGGVSAKNIAHWDGTNWSALGGGLESPPYQQGLWAVVANKGSVYAGGTISKAFRTDGTTVPVSNIGEWKGETWSSMGGGVDGTVYALAAAGGYVYVGGIFTNAGGGIKSQGLARWDGTSWSSVGGGVGGDVFAIVAQGSNVYVGGNFFDHIARWDGSSWWPMRGLYGTVYSLTARDNEVFAAGDFSRDTGGLARWNGTTWDFPLGSLWFPSRIAANNYLYLNLDILVSWNSCFGFGHLGTGINPTLAGYVVRGLAVDGRDLFAVGDFESAGGKTSFHVAHWKAANFPKVGINSFPQVWVGSGSTTQLQFMVSICPRPEEPISIDYRTTNDTALPGVHYEAVSGVLLFTKSAPTEQVISIPVLIRPSYFFCKTLYLDLSTTNAVLGSLPRGTGYICSSLPAPTISINDASGLEGDAGTNFLPFTFSLTAPVDDPVSVGLKFQDLTAMKYVDYLPILTNIAIPSGQLTQTFFVPVLGNTIREVDKQFLVTLSGMVSTNKGQALGTIFNDDTVPGLTQIPSMVYVTEPDSPSVAVASVRLSAPVEQTVTVDFATSDGSARAGADYLMSAGRLVFPPGSTTQFVRIVILSDFYAEGDETFFVNFTNPVNASLLATQATWTILSVDKVSLPAGFSASLIATGLSYPTRMAFAPDGRLFVCEQGGKIWILHDGVRLPTPFLSVSTAQGGSSETGLLGLAFDPGFVTNQFFYVYYTTAGHNRISRFTARGDSFVSGSEIVLQELDSPVSGIHNGGDLHFGIDGKLYASVGEQGSSTNSQTLNTRLGKLLRLNADGTVPSDNPFYGVAAGPNRAIWALGLRNPFAFAFEAGTGRLFINDVGSSEWEEINEGYPGANYGWPLAEGKTNNAAFRNPLFAYRQFNSVPFFTGCAITGGTFLPQAPLAFDPAYAGDYFFADYCGGWIRRIPCTNDNLSIEFATGFSSPVDLKPGSDGSLYCLCYNFRDRFGASQAGRIYRIYKYGDPSHFDGVKSPTNGVIELRTTGEAGRLYSLEVSTNLVNWQRLTSVIAPTQTFSIRDVLQQVGERFYRLAE